jgi:hypothetical protein
MVIMFMMGPARFNGTSPSSEDAAAAIRSEMVSTWQVYQSHAKDFDSLKPLSRRGVNDWGSIQMTLLDSLDTLLLMGLTREFKLACARLSPKMFQQDNYVSVFETTIRALGGLLAAHSLVPANAPRCKEVLFACVSDLALRLSPALNHTLPFDNVNLLTGSVRYHVPLSLAEVST